MKSQQEIEEELREKVALFFYNVKYPEGYSQKEIEKYEEKVDTLMGYFDTAIRQIRQDDIKSLIEWAENMRKRHIHKAVRIANVYEYDPVNMLKCIERPEIRYMVQNLMDTERELGDIISHLQSQLKDEKQ